MVKWRLWSTWVLSCSCLKINPKNIIFLIVLITQGAPLSSPFICLVLPSSHFCLPELPWAWSSNMLYYHTHEYEESLSPPSHAKLHYCLLHSIIACHISFPLDHRNKVIWNKNHFINLCVRQRSIFFRLMASAKNKSKAYHARLKEHK